MQLPLLWLLFLKSEPLTLNVKAWFGEGAVREKCLNSEVLHPHFSKKFALQLFV